MKSVQKMKTENNTPNKKQVSLAQIFKNELD